MKRFIFAERNGIFIIDLQKTLKQLDRSFDYVRDLAERAG
jgi:small subunit ribosomal protein S2